jgi:hypothetical protein
MKHGRFVSTVAALAASLAVTAGGVQARTDPNDGWVPAPPKTAKAAKAHTSRKPTAPAHWRGWLCIHSREGAWNADTGNGFYGGLQMTYNWMGVIRGKASWYSPLKQMWAAERVSARYGFSWSWLRGQWPNTYPPCAGLFAH